MYINTQSKHDNGNPVLSIIKCQISKKRSVLEYIIQVMDETNSIPM